jgi:HEPN domain-containing protein
MSDLEHAKDMLTMAREDLDALHAMGDNPAFIDKIFGFHAQQAAEKALKAWLSFIQVKYPLIHDLKELMELLQDNEQTVPPEFGQLSTLTKFAVQRRYEIPSLSDQPLDRSSTLRQIERLFNHVMDLVSRA